MLLLNDIADLRTIKRHEVFLGLKRDPRHGKSFKLSPIFSFFYFLFAFAHCYISLCRLFKLLIGLKSW